MSNFILFLKATYYSLNVVIWAGVGGIFLAVVLYYVSKLYIGGFVRKCLKQATDEENAKTIEELGYKNHFIIKYVLKSGSLKHVLAIAGGNVPEELKDDKNSDKQAETTADVEPEDATEEVNSKTEAQPTSEANAEPKTIEGTDEQQKTEQPEPSSENKAHFNCDFDTAKFYIPSELNARAYVQYGEKPKILTLALIIAFLVACAILLPIFLPSLLDILKVPYK